MDMDTLLLEQAVREQEKRTEAERKDFLSFVQTLFKGEKNQQFLVNWHHKIIASHLERVMTGEIKRLMINIPPNSGKTELITKNFPVYAMGKKPDLQVIATGYSASLAQINSSSAREIYKSQTYNKIFPRCSPIKQDQDTKGLWQNEAGGQFLATGVGGSITGHRGNIFIIDDPIKPDEADTSDVKREAVNRWYDNTVLSRLKDPDNDAVIIVMQRTHENDLCGYLLEKEKAGVGDKWEHLVIKAIAEEDDEYRSVGESYHPERISAETLESMRRNKASVFATQYQQEPVNKDVQEFHEEFFKYYEDKDLPRGLRIFTVVDPAFRLKQHNDESAIITGGFYGDHLYILEITHGRYDASALIDKIVYHAKKWNPEKIGIEAVQAQTVIGQFLKKRLLDERRPIPVDEISQRIEKEARIRKLIGPIRYGLILWKRIELALEHQLKKFPRGKFDDIIDALQMLYELYQLPPAKREREADESLSEFLNNQQYDETGSPI